ncbi:hypothetical protein EON63_08710 [archaeon]|nr:MAG: hypothetical protein EON63_08710 [archaeon]
MYVESTGIWYRGDFASKMLFSFSKETMAFSLVATENVISDSTTSTSNSLENILGPRCERCTRLARRSWEQLQVTGNSAFWPLVVFGAPYYISDYEGRNLFFMGKVCDGVSTFECYQTLVDGVYTLRLGMGLFGPLTNFPFPNASWSGCEEQGGDRQQLIFRIRDGRCIPLQTYTYLTRCDRPDAVNAQVGVEGVAVPTHGGTVAPTQSVYGDPYIKGQMYVHTGKRVKEGRDVDDGGNDRNRGGDGDGDSGGKYHIDNMPDHMYIV